MSSSVIIWLVLLTGISPATETGNESVGQPITGTVDLDMSLPDWICQLERFELDDSAAGVLAALQHEADRATEIEQLRKCQVAFAMLNEQVDARELGLPLSRARRRYCLGIVLWRFLFWDQAQTYLDSAATELTLESYERHHALCYSAQIDLMRGDSKPGFAKLKRILAEDARNKEALHVKRIWFPEDKEGLRQAPTDNKPEQRPGPWIEF
ncbi:MAG: hypothetical protein AB7S38_29280 [Vulcanimicrobiota bacterium]